MAENFSFDIASEVNFQELNNAINQTTKEVTQRYDLKDSKTEIDFNQDANTITIHSADEFKVKAVIEILKAKAIKREISPKAFIEGKVETALGQTAKMTLTIQNGISKEHCKDIVKALKDLKLKIQTQIQNDQIRVSSPKKDELQNVIKFLREKNYSFPLQFINYR